MDGGVGLGMEEARRRLLRLGPGALSNIELVGVLLGGEELKRAATLLEGLALWHQQPLSVVLSADASDDGTALGLCDALGFGRSLHYEVALAYADRWRGCFHRRPAFLPRGR